MNARADRTTKYRRLQTWILTHLLIIRYILTMWEVRTGKYTAHELRQKVVKKWLYCRKIFSSFLRVSERNSQFQIQNPWLTLQFLAYFKSKIRIYVFGKCNRVMRMRGGRLSFAQRQPIWPYTHCDFHRIAWAGPNFSDDITLLSCLCHHRKR